jgi:hypothetical protein
MVVEVVNCAVVDSEAVEGSAPGKDDEGKAFFTVVPFARPAEVVEKLLEVGLPTTVVADGVVPS